MKINKIVKLNLELRAVALREDGKTFDEISSILSDESKNSITLSTVFRYFEAYEKSKASILERQEPLKIKSIELEISTIEDRQRIIQGLLDIAENGLEERNRVLAFKTAVEAIDSLDRRQGKLTNNQGVTINNINAVKLAEVSTEDLLRMINVTN